MQSYSGRGSGVWEDPLVECVVHLLPSVVAISGEDDVYYKMSQRTHIVSIHSIALYSFEVSF